MSEVAPEVVTAIRNGIVKEGSEPSEILDAIVLSILKSLKEAGYEVRKAVTLCPKCSGTGSVMRDERSTDTPSRADLIQCPECYGHGNLRP